MQQPSLNKKLNKKTNKDFGKIEKNIDSKIPKYIKLFLQSTGFDCEFSILSIEESCIKYIESFLQVNRCLLAKTKYEHISPFKFNIADKTAILSLPRLIRESKEKAAKKQLEAKKLSIVANFNERELKKELLERVNSVLNRKNIQYLIEEKDIIGCEVASDKIEVKVHCTKCKSTLRCHKSNRWFCSNLFAHFGRHQNNGQSNENASKNDKAPASLAKKTDRKRLAAPHVVPIRVNPSSKVLQLILSGPKEK